MGCLPKLAIGVVGILLVSVGLVVLGAVLSASKTQHDEKAEVSQKTATASPVVEDTSKATAVTLPAAETAFISTVQSYVSRYTSASNELQKSTLRTERKASLARLGTTVNVSSWVGTLKKMGTYSDGKASISIQLEGSQIVVRTDVGNPLEGV